MKFLEVSISQLGDTVIHTLPPRFISAAIDSSVIIGGYWWDGGSSSAGGLGTQQVQPLDLDSKALIRLARHLNLGYLRIGGTEADHFYYQMKKKKKRSSPLSEHSYDLNRKRWKQIVEFSKSIDAKLFMTLNAGPEARKADSSWRKKNARSLIRYSRSHRQHTAVWELGNEVNAYFFFHGFRNRISGRQYASDISKLGKILQKEKTGRIAGPAMAVLPVLGEVLPFSRSFLKNLSSTLDILTWHYYPQQSSRCPAAVRRAKSGTLLVPRRLDSFGRQARRISKLVQKYSPDTEIWLGETGHALCGGEHGISDRFVSSHWWVDQLGQLALAGHRQAVRQSLVGGDYGLLRIKDLSPTPDYWTSLLWNRFMGREVYKIRLSGSRMIRAYLHSSKETKDGKTLLLINLDQKRSARISLTESLPPARMRALVTADDLLSPSLRFNSVPLVLGKKERLPNLAQEKLTPLRDLELPPLSFGFFTLF